MPISAQELQQTLADLPTLGTRVKAHDYREVWRFEFGGKPYYLKFYPRAGSFWKRMFRGSPALREFTNLQLLQKAKVPSPRAVAHLSGFTMGARKGDAVILEGIEPSLPLDQFLNDKLLAGEVVENHRQLAAEVISIVQKLGQAKLGHRDLHLGNFLLREGELYLLDGYAVRAGGMTTKDVMRLGHSVARFATKTDVLRGWRAFTDAPLPRKNSVRRRQWRKAVEASLGNNRWYGVMKFGDGWSGPFYRQCKFPRRWAPLSKLVVTEEDLRREWPNLLARIEADQLEIIKRSKSGDVLAGEIALGGKPVSVIVKRNRRAKWYRYVNEIGRGVRSIRAWKKAWSLIARDIPTAWPLFMAQRSVLGYFTSDNLIVFERVRGKLLHDRDLDALDGVARQNLFRRLGRTLRLLEARGLRQYDSKSTNWIITDDPKLGPVPVIIDVDGIRRITPANWPIDRLLRSMREHPQYTPADSKELCLGYAPYARLSPTPQGGDGPGEGGDDPSQDASPLRPNLSPLTPTLSPRGEREQER